MKKKLLLSLGAVFMALTLTACGGTEKGANTSLEDTFSEESYEESSSEYDEESYEEKEEDYEEEEEDEDAYLIPYREKATVILEKTETLVNALKAGDIKTVVELGYPKDEVTKSLSNVVDSEKAKKIMQTVYKDVCFEITEEDIEYLAKQLYEIEGMDFDEDEEFSVNLDAFAYRWMLGFRMSALTYFEDGVTVPEDFKPESEEQAFAILEKGLSVTPIQYMSSINITVPDKDGNFYFLYEDDYLFKDAGLEYLGRASEDNMTAYYISKLMDVISDYKIGDTTATYQKYNDLYTEATNLLKQKDFEKITDLLENSEDTECDYREKLGSYAELNDAQKAFVDDFVSQLEIVTVDYSWVHADGTKVRAGGVTIIAPDYENWGKPLEEFSKENNIKNGGSYFYYESSSVKTLDGALLYDYYRAINYAKNNIN